MFEEISQLVIIFVIGAVALIFGFLMLFKPELLVKWGERLNRVLTTEEIFYKRRNIFGLFLVLAGIYMLYQVYETYINHIG